MVASDRKTELKGRIERGCGFGIETGRDGTTPNLGTGRASLEEA